MIYYNIIIKSMHWPKRMKKIKKIINKIFINRKYFNFKKNIVYYCNFILMNDNIIKQFNKNYRKNKKSTDVLTFVSNNCKNHNKIEKYCDDIC